MSDAYFPHIATLLNTMGQPCPAPLLMLKKALKMQAIRPILLQSSDPHSQNDILRYCQIHQIPCVMEKISATEFHYLIES